MMFVFASLGNQQSGWPVQLMHQTEAALITVALICFVVALFLKRAAACVVVAVIGGTSSGFGVVMPLELAPFFFGARGEVMLASVLLIFAYPIAVALFIVLFLVIMEPTRNKIFNS